MMSLIWNAEPNKKALYPIIIILLVALEKNKEEDRDVFSLSQSMRFAAEAHPHVSTESSGDSEALDSSFGNQK